MQGIVTVGEKILLARHRRGRESYWVLPGGHREPGETLEGALARELEEEAAVTPVVATLFSVSEVFLPGREVLDVVFRVHGIRGEPRLGRPPADLPDRRLHALALHPRAALGRLAFRPAALAAAVARAWTRNEWEPCRYLGDLTAPAGRARPGRARNAGRRRSAPPDASTTRRRT